MAASFISGGHYPMMHDDEEFGGYLSTNGYGDWKFNSFEMRTRAETLARDLPGVMKELNADFIAVRGTSGTFIAGALQMFLDVPVMLMRKPGEVSHGCMIEGDPRHVYKRGIIVDDFICSGDTVEGMVRDLDRAVLPVKFVGMVEHQSSDDPSNRLQRRTSTKTMIAGLPVYTFK